MKLRLQNSKNSTLRLILEPWASEALLAPGDIIWVVAEGVVPESAYFDVASHDEDVVVTAEWDGAVAYLCDGAGKKLD